MRKNKVIIEVIIFLFEDMSLSLNMWHMAVSVIHIKGKVINQLLSCILLYCSFQSVVQYMVSSLSLVTEVMCIPASPGFWMIYPMILE